MIRRPEIKLGARPDHRAPEVVPVGTRHVPAWWVDEYPERSRFVCTSKYDKLQSAGDAETGMLQANYIVAKATGRLR